MSSASNKLCIFLPLTMNLEKTLFMGSLSFSLHLVCFVYSPTSHQITLISRQFCVVIFRGWILKLEGKKTALCKNQHVYRFSGALQTSLIPTLSRFLFSSQCQWVRLQVELSSRLSSTGTLNCYQNAVLMSEAWSSYLTFLP